MPDFIIEDSVPDIAHFTQDLVPERVTFQYLRLQNVAEGGWLLWPYDSLEEHTISYTIEGEAKIRSVIMNWCLENGHDESYVDFALRFPPMYYNLLADYWLWRIPNTDSMQNLEINLRVEWSNPKRVQGLMSMTKIQLFQFLDGLNLMFEPLNIRRPPERTRKAALVDLVASHCHFIEKKWPLNCRDCGLPLRRYGGMIVPGKTPGTCNGQHRIGNRTQIRGTSPDFSGKWVSRKTGQRISMRTKGVPSNEEKSP